MSSRNLRNVVRAKEHKERSQPHARRKLGLLEKKKDYKQRAQDYHRKEDTLKKLREKASLRNPDEFYMKMKNTSTKDGVHQVEKKQNALDNAKALLFKTQDVAYLNMKRASDEKKIQSLKESLHFLDVNKQTSFKRKRGDDDDGDDDDDDDDGLDDDELSRVSKKAKGSNSHVIFVDSPQQLQSFDVAKHFNTVPELVGRSHNRLTKEQLKQDSVVVLPKDLANAANGIKSREMSIAAKLVKAAEKEAEKSYSSLDARIKRKTKIENTQQKVQLQRNLMGKGAKKKMVIRDKFGDVDEDKSFFVWRQERKK